MANSIQISELFTQLVDEKYQATALSSVFEDNTIEVGKNHAKFHIL